MAPEGPLLGPIYDAWDGGDTGAHRTRARPDLAARDGHRAATTRPPSPGAPRRRGRRRDTLPQPAEAEWIAGDGQRMARAGGVAGARVVARRRHHRLTRGEQLRNRGELVAARFECGDDAGERTLGVPPAAVGVE